MQRRQKSKSHSSVEIEREGKTEAKLCYSRNIYRGESCDPRSHLSSLHSHGEGGKGGETQDFPAEWRSQRRLFSSAEFPQINIHRQGTNLLLSKISKLCTGVGEKTGRQEKPSSYTLTSDSELPRFEVAHCPAALEACVLRVRLTKCIIQF